MGIDGITKGTTGANMDGTGSISEPTTEGRCEVLDETVSTAGEKLPISGLSLHQIELQYPDDYEILLEKLYDLDDGIVRKLMDQDWTNAGVLFEHVYPIDEFTDIARLTAELDRFGNAFTHRRLFGYSFDAKDVHIWHDCSYGNSSCRCKLKIKFQNLKAKADAQRKPCGHIGEEWLPFCLYFLFRKRGNQKVWIGGACQGPSDQRKYKQISRDKITNM